VAESQTQRLKREKREVRIGNVGGVVPERGAGDLGGSLAAIAGYKTVNGSLNDRVTAPCARWSPRLTKSKTGDGKVSPLEAAQIGGKCEDLASVPGRPSTPA